MKMVAICFSDEGAERIRQIMERDTKLRVTGFYKTEREQEGLLRISGSTEELVAQCFREQTPLLFVGASGIAVRMIAPFVKDKLTDIPVLVMDEAGRFLIPLLSGHVGGANRLAEHLARVMGATPVITTATDVQGVFSVDSFATEHRLTIETRDGIREVSAKALRGEPIRIHITEDAQKADVLIGEQRIVDAPLWLSPKRYVLGIGCKKGMDVEKIEALAERVMQELGIGYPDIYAFGSVDLKAEEPGLLSFSARHRIPFVTFSAERLSCVEGEFTASEFVQSTVGVDNVCERAAVLLSGGGEPVVRKQAENGVTIAVAKRRGL